MDHNLKKNNFLDENVFHGLKNLNDGFDVPAIKYFSAEDFKMVLDRVAHLKLGIYGIEPWLNGKYYDVLTFDQFAEEPTDEDWYRLAFEKFNALNLELQYGASYYVPSIEEQIK